MYPYDDLQEEDESNLSPYPTITDRQPLEPVSPLDQQGQSNPVRDMIASRMSTPDRSESNYTTNFAQAMSNMARGASAPVDQSPFYANLNKQNESAADAALKEQQLVAQRVSDAIKMKQIQSRADAQLAWQKQNAVDQRTFISGENDKNNVARIKAAGLSAGRGNSERDEKAVERLSGKLGSTQDAASSILDIEEELGFNLDTFDKNTGKRIDPKTGKPSVEIDLPGVSLPALGRVSFYDDKARTLRDTASRLFNLDLKDRSGAAVSDQELARLKQEYSDGKFNTEPELLGAMQRYKNRLKIKMHDIEASNPDAAKQYASQGGSTSRILDTSTAPPPARKYRDQGGHRYYLNEATGAYE